MKFLAIFDTGEQYIVKADSMSKAVSYLTWKFDNLISITKMPEEEET